MGAKHATCFIYFFLFSFFFMYLFMYLSIYLSIYPFIHSFIHLFIYFILKGNVHLLRVAGDQSCSKLCNCSFKSITEDMRQPR